MKIYRLSIFVLLVILLAGCSVGEYLEKRYYIFDYNDQDERTDLFLSNPLPYQVIVQDARIAHSYTRKQIVKRHYGPQIRYMDYNLWGVRLQDAIPALINTRINKYGIFENSSRDLLLDLPDYQINTTVNNLEIYETEFLSEAHLNIKFDLVRLNDTDDQIPDINVSYSIDRTARIELDDVESFVQKVNQMILQETDNFIIRILNRFTGYQITDQAEQDTETFYQEIDYAADIVGDSTRTDNGGIGLIYLTNLSGSDNEPYYYAYDKNNDFAGSARMGEELPLSEGNYLIKYGSLSSEKLMSRKVEVIPRFRYNVEPDWGCLVVEIIDEQRNYVKVPYNIYDNKDGFDFGIDYPADINLGEESTVWVLKPGTYKVTVNSESYSTYRDFTTIEVLENVCQRLTLIVEEDEESSDTYTMIGAGVMNESDFQRTDSNWKLGSAIHLNMNLNTDNSDNEDETKTSINMSAQLDNNAYYERGRLRYTLKNLIEAGTNKDEDYDQFRVDMDEFDLKNTVIINLFSAFGLYGRADINTHFFPGKAYDLNCIKISAQGDTILMGANYESIDTNPSLFPMTLKEGFGLNVQFLNSARSDMNLRFGLGARQDLKNDVYTYAYDWVHPESETNFTVYKEDESIYYEGVEASLVGDMQFFSNLSYSLTADFLFPFDEDKNYTMDLENSFNVKLFKYVSLDYRLKFLTKESETQDDYISTEQSLFLRFTYILR